MILQHILKIRSPNISIYWCYARKERIFTTALCRSEDDKLLPRPASKKIVDSLKKKDSIPHNFELIYRSPDLIYFQGAQANVLFLSAFVPSITSFVCFSQNFCFPVVIKGVLFESLWTFVWVNTFSIGIGIATYLLVNRFPVRIYYNEQTKEYISAFLHALPWMTYQKAFKQGDVTIIDEEPAWYTYMYASNYKLKGEKIILVEENFRLPIDLQNMLKKPK